MMSRWCPDGLQHVQISMQLWDPSWKFGDPAIWAMWTKWEQTWAGAGADGADGSFVAMTWHALPCVHPIPSLNGLRSTFDLLRRIPPDTGLPTCTKLFTATKVATAMWKEMGSSSGIHLRCTRTCRKTSRLGWNDPSNIDGHPVAIFTSWIGKLMQIAIDKYWQEMTTVSFLALVLATSSWAPCSLAWPPLPRRASKLWRKRMEKVGVDDALTKQARWKISSWELSVWTQKTLWLSSG